MEPGVTSQPTEYLDGIEFDYQRESRCKVCSAGDPRTELPNGDEVRRLVDAWLVQGRTYRDIREGVDYLMTEWPPDRRPSYFSIRNHQRRHLPVDQVVIREIIERRAIARQLQIAVGRGPLVTSAAVFELVRMKGFEALAACEITPSVKETLEAARLLEGLDGETGNQLEGMRAAVAVLLIVLREHLQSDQLEAVVADYQARLTHVQGSGVLEIPGLGMGALGRDPAATDPGENTTGAHLRPKGADS